MNTLKQRLFTNWNFMRFLRLAMAIWILGMAIQSHDWWIGLLSGLFIVLAATNTGCCGANGCAVPMNSPANKQASIETINEGLQEIK